MCCQKVRIMRYRNRGYRSAGVGPALGVICGERCGEREMEAEGPWHKARRHGRVVAVWRRG